MKPANITFLESVLRELSKKKVMYRIVDDRWKSGGDVDIVVSKASLSEFEDVLRRTGFKRKGFWPPHARAYKAFKNGENLWIGGHIGGYIGGLGGGLGSIGKVFDPSSAAGYPKAYLQREAQLFIILYKYRTRKDNSKYKKHFAKLTKGSKGMDYKELRRLLRLAFRNPDKVVRQLRAGRGIERLGLELKPWVSFKLRFKGRLNRSLRFFYKLFFPAPYVALVGCNGTGKSTTTRRLVDLLGAQKLKVKRVYSGRFRSQILPINFIGKFIKPTKVERGKDHHKGTKRKNMREVRIFDSRFLRFVVPIAYYFEYLLRYILKIYPLRVRNDIVVTDRAFIDVFNSPNTNKAVCRFLFRLMPNPKFILLYNDAQTLLKRRPEFQLKHIKEQLKVYSQFDRIYMMKVKTDRPEIVEEVAKKVSELI